MSAVREVTSLLPNYRDATSPVGSEVAVSTDHVAPNFFTMVGIPLNEGRAFTGDDLPGRPGVAILNAALAAKLFPGTSAVGRQVKSVVAKDSLTVVGVVANATRGDPRISSAPTVYLPGLQEPARFIAPMVIVRAAPRLDLRGAVQAAIAPLGRHTVLFARSVDEQIDQHLARERVLSYLSASVAMLGLVVGALGLFGLLAYSVSARTRELGLRMALGGTRERLASMVAREGMTLVVFGLVVGLPAAYGAGRLSASLLYGVSPSDWIALVGAAMTMVVVGLAACLLPALRIASITPAEALRQD